jgi:hypothetical protein
LPERIIELCDMDERFERATNILAEAGEDLVKLFMVTELIEKAHGKCPPKGKRGERSRFCAKL